MKKTLITLMAITLIFPVLEARASIRMNVSAYVNLLTDYAQDAAYDTHSKIQVTECSGDACGQGKASIKELNTSAYSYGTGLMHPSVGTSFISLAYDVVGNVEGLPLPITITAELKGTTAAYTVPGDMGSVALARISWNTYDGNGDWGVITSQGGIPVIYREMTNNIVSVTLTPVVRIGVGKIGVSISLDKKDLEALGFDQEISDYSDSTEWNAASVILAKAIYTLGLAYHGVQPGTTVKVGFDMTVHTTSTITSTRDVFYNGIFMIFTASQASTSCFPAKGIAKLDTSIKSISATVPNNYIYDISDIYLNIDGKNIPVERSE